MSCVLVCIGVCCLFLMAIMLGSVILAILGGK